MDLPGQDYAAFCVSSADQCRELCRVQAQCQAYTYIHTSSQAGIENLPAWMKNCNRQWMGMGNGAAACFLKSGVPNRVSQPRFVFQRNVYTYKSGAKETVTRQRTTPRGCQWGNSITRPGQRACFCWEGSYQVERPIHVCQGN